MPTYVFAYGSLALLDPSAAEYRLEGFVRTWDVAMDNRDDLPGYKFYEDPQGGGRPQVHVAFLNLTAQEGSAVNGVLLEATPADLQVMDDRERNYQRVTVTEHVRPRARGEVYAYVGTPQARRRFDRGMAQGTCTVDANYLAAVRDGFAALGPEALDRFDATTHQPPCAVRPLVRHDL